MDRNIDILVVDDDLNLRKTLSAILKAKGYIPLTAATGKTALDIAGKQMPVVALIDLKLEDMFGLEVMRGIKECCPSTECIVLTGYASQESAIEAVNLGAYSYVQKPYDMEQLLLTIRRAVEKREAEEAFRESEEKYREVVNTSIDGVISVDSQMKIGVWNKGAERIFGYTQEEMLGQSLEKIVPERHREAMEKGFAEYRKSGSGPVIGKVVELQGVRKVGTEIPIELSISSRKIGETYLTTAIARDITERKQAEEKIKAKSHFLESLIQQSPLPTFVMDSKGFTVMVNEAFLKFYAVPDKEMILGRNALTEPANVSQGVVKYFKEALSGKIVEVPEIEFVSPYKNKKSITRCRMFPIVDPTGTLTNVVVVQEDITRRKCAEEALKESETQYRNLYSMMRLMSDNLPDLIWTKDMEGKFLFVNKACSEILLDAKDTDEPIGKTDIYFADRMMKSYPEIPDYLTFGKKCAESDLTVIETKKPMRFDESGNVKGKFLFLDVYKAPFDDENGNIVGTVGSARIVTEERQMEKALLESEQQLAGIISSVTDHMSMIDEHYNIVWANDVAKRLFGPNLIGKKCYAAYHRRDEVCGPCVVSRTFEDGKIHEHETEAIGAEGKRMVFWCTANVAARYEDGRPRLVVEIARDITERKKLEAQLIQAHKMEAIGRLAGGVAHDFNNLLTVIKGYSQMMLRKLKPDDPDYGDLLEIKKAGDRASGLTEQLLAFSRKQVIQPRIFDLNTVVADTEKMLGRLIGEDIDLVALLDPNLGDLRMDPGQIQQILMNLAVNARDAMPEGGTLTLETAGINVGESYILEDVEVQKGSYVILTVSDTGVGMDKETMSYVFEPFFSTKEKGKGTGLGLSTVYGIVKQNNGYIWLSSELGKGTTVRIYLPRVLESTGVSEPDQTDL